MTFLEIIKRGLFDGQKSLPAAVKQNKDYFGCKIFSGDF